MVGDVSFGRGGRVMALFSRAPISLLQRKREKEGGNGALKLLSPTQGKACMHRESCALDTLGSINGWLNSSEMGISDRLVDRDRRAEFEVG